MKTFLLILLTLDSHTGQVIRSAAVGAPFRTFEACLRAAIERGPQRSDGDHVLVLVCSSPDDELARDRRRGQLFDHHGVG